MIKCCRFQGIKITNKNVQFQKISIPMPPQGRLTEIPKLKEEDFFFKGKYDTKIEFAATMGSSS